MRSGCSSSPDLQYILNIRKRYDEQQEKTSISINLDTRRAEKIDRQLWLLATENQRRAAQNLETFKTFEDLEEFNKIKKIMIVILILIFKMTIF